MLSFPEDESRVGLASILPLAAEPAAGRRKGKRMFSREFPKKRRMCFGTEVIITTAAWTCFVTLHGRAGDGCGCGGAVPSTVEKKMQPILPLTPSRWDQPSK